MKRCLPLALTGLLVLSGCARRETMVAAGNRDQVMLVGNKDEPATLDPATNVAISTSRILGALFEGLVEYSADGQSVVPGAAERWEVSPDGLTYTFHLRAAARWSNGTAVTADDFRDSFLRILDPQMASENAGMALAIVGARDFIAGRTTDPTSVGLRSLDPRTFVIQLAYPAPYLLKMIAMDPFYPVYLPSVDANGGRRQRGGSWTSPGILVSNGPFRLAEWKPNAYLSVRANPNFWDAGRVHLREVRFFPTDDEGAEERAFRAGQLHLTYRLPQSKVAAYAEDHPGELHLIPSLRTDFLTFNITRAPFGDRRVRQALSLAIDRDRLVRAVLGRMGSPAQSWVRPGTGGFEPTPRFHHDPVEAARLLAAAGFPGGAGFPAVEFSLNGTSGSTLAVAEVLQQMWLEVLGIRVDLRPLEFKVYLSAARDRQFQLLLEGYSPFPDPHDLLTFGLREDPNDDAGVNDPEYDRAFALADRTLEPATRLAAFDAVEAINARKVYYAPLFFTNRGILLAPSVRGWRDRSLAVLDWRDLSLQP